MGIVITRIVIFILLGSSLSGLFYLLGKHNVQNMIRSNIQDAYESLENTSLLKNRERQLQSWWEPKNRLDKLIEKPRKRLQYSGLQNYIPGLKIEIWLVLYVLVTAAIYFLAFFVTGKLLISLITVAVFIAIIETIQTLLIYRNYKIVGDNMISFLDMLKNYLATTGEITEALFLTSKYMKEPLRSALEECYFIAQKNGDSHTALRGLSDRIEHPLFKDFIDNLEMSMNYTANFKELIYASRDMASEDRIDQRERKSFALEEVGIVILVIITLTILSVKVDSLLEKSLWDIFLYTDIGKSGLALSGISFLLFLKKIITIGK